MRRPVIAGNWKMHMTCAQARDYMATLLPLIADTPSDRDLVLAPPFTALSTMAEVAKDSSVSLASQNVHWEAEGAFTGEIAPSMLEEHGVRYAIVGHSEPRKYFSESDEQINHRARSAQAHGLIPIVCVGESDEQRTRGEAERVIRRQVEGFTAARERLPELAKLVDERDWTFTRNLIHGPMQEVGREMLYINQRLLPQDRAEANKLATSLKDAMADLDEAARLQDSAKLQKAYDDLEADFANYSAVIPEQALS